MTFIDRLHFVTTPSGAVYSCTCAIAQDHTAQIVGPDKITPEMAAAWREVNRVLDENGGKDSPEFRAAWASWEQLVRGDQ